MTFALLACRGQRVHDIRTWLLALGLGAAFSSGCAPSAIDKPAAPDTSRLQADFAAPSGQVQLPALADASAVLLPTLRSVQQFCAVTAHRDTACPAGAGCQVCQLQLQLASVLSDVSRALHGDGDDDVPTIGGTDGALWVDAICPGWTQRHDDEVANGLIGAHVTFTGSGLDPVVWGHLSRCELLSDGTASRYDGDFIMTYEPAPSVPFDQVGNVPTILWFQGEVFDRDTGTTASVRVGTRRRLDQMGIVEFLIDAPPYGTFVATFNGPVTQLRGASVLFTCDVQENRCEFVPPG
ncbi:MAG TPA: hypothetical protein VI299_11490 [Polyangiales bacterium]